MTVGRIDRLTRYAFRTDEFGREIYHPWGYRRTGYVLPDADAKQRIVRAMRRLSIAAWFLMVAAVIGVAALWPGNDDVAMAVACLPLGVVYYLAYRMVAKSHTGATLATAPGLTHHEVLQVVASRHSPGYFRWVAALMVFVGVAWLAMPPRLSPLPGELVWIDLSLWVGLGILVLGTLVRAVRLARIGSDNVRPETDVPADDLSVDR